MLSCAHPLGLCSIHPYQTKELIARLVIPLEAPEYATGHSGGACFLYATHYHAEVGRFHDHSNALWVENLHDSVGNVLREAFLDLKSSREHFGNAWEF